ncbi:MAG: S41 family peptidase [Planctomycetes bacterium]|nr:S41 family peptidase [Planctomycetota bacterium]
MIDRTAKTYRIAAAVGLLLLIQSPGAFLQAEDDTGASTRVARMVSMLQKRQGDSFWSLVSRIEELGKPAIPALKSRLAAESEKTRLGCAKALLGLGDSAARREALKTLGDLAEKSKDRDIKIDAIGVYWLAGDPDDIIDRLEGQLASETDPGILISLAVCLWDVDNLTSARNKLLDLLGSRDSAVSQEAALALAESGNYDDGRVKNTLRRLRKEPTPRGRRADLLYRLMKLEKQLDDRLFKGSAVPEGTDMKKLLEKKEERISSLEARLEKMELGGPGAAGGTQARGDKLLDEIIAKVQKLYVDKDKTTRERLVRAAVKGMVRSLDDHSVFMEAEDSKSFQEDIKGRYAGIGTQITKVPGGQLEVLRPIYGGPAYKAGILSGDRIIEIEGQRSAKLEMDAVKDLLRGPSGTEVKLKVLRRGWSEAREFTFRRATIKVSSVLHETLPGQVGYIKLNQFGGSSAEEFTEALEDLERDGLKGLIIDFRNNPGGYLPVAEKIADLFVRGKLPIVTQKGLASEDGPERSTFPTEKARTGYPIVCLVNEHSASASEVVSGCLQDYDRATLVGQRTYGKGSVQRLVGVDSEKGAMLKITVQYWYLPLGRCINTIRNEKGLVTKEGGVEPDVKVQQKVPALWRLEERRSLRNNEALLGYTEKHLDALRSIATLGDRGDPSRYPELEKILAAVETKGTEADVRQVIRDILRRKLEDERGRQFALDLQEDLQLQQGILSLLKAMRKNPAEIAEYAWIKPLPAPEKEE